LGDLGKRGLGPAFEEVFDQNLIKFEGAETAKQLFDFINTDKGVVRDTNITGYALPSEFDEGEDYPIVANYKGFETTYTIKDYGARVIVTQDCIDDRERVGKALDEFAGLTKTSSIHEYKGAFQILNGGFSSAATYNGFSIARYNSAALFQASHLRADGGTAQSNYSASAITLTELNLETGRLALVKQLTDNGLPIIEMGTITVAVPDDLEKNAVIYTGSQLRASTGNNDLNFYRGRMNVVSSRWLDATNGGSATAWFLIASIPGASKPLKVYRKGGPKYEEMPKDSGNGNRTFAIKNRFAVGYSGFLGSWASAGA
jgi:hypothetical protein